MEREIKFEYGFDSVNGIVKKVYFLYKIPLISTICDVWNELPIKYVREYTGFKDKNGKEIFEGDIVRVDTTKTQHFGGIHTKVIEWGQKGGWHPMETHCDNLYSFLHDIHGHNVSEVIGNKYENPELLTEE